MKVYMLYHYYEINSQEDETKILGVFSSEEKAVSAIDYYKALPGFRDYDESCFLIEDYELNKEHWGEGFFTVCDEWEG